jgi:ABC-type multidrug transport system fused ATPase/permease subunit
VQKKDPAQRLALPADCGVAMACQPGQAAQQVWQVMDRGRFLQTVGQPAGSQDAASRSRRQPRSVLGEVLGLASGIEGIRPRLVLLVLAGLGAAFAEAFGIGLAVLFLFALLGDSDGLKQVDGIFARLFERFGAQADPQMFAAVLFVLILLSAGLIYLHGVMAAAMANRVAEHARDTVHSIYVTVGYRWLQEQEQGALIHTLATETWLAAEAFDHLARITVHACAALVFGAALLFLSWQILLTALLAAGTTFLLIRLLLRPVRRLGAAQLAENRRLAERMLMSLHGMRTIRAFAQEAHMLEQFGQASARVREYAVRGERLKALNGPLQEVGSLGALILIAVVASRIGIGIPTIIASALLLFRMQPHLKGIDARRLALANMRPSLENLREVLEPGNKPWPVEGVGQFDRLTREIRFEGVRFTHDTRRGPSLQDAVFAIPAGKTTVLSGPSGSGKSTLINLLLRLYEPEAGQILVDGADLAGLSRQSWLSRVAIAGQDVELVEGSVIDNIRIARPDASFADIRETCAVVEILADIESIPEGFDARIGPGGLSFSGGQRQRIGLARALIRRPDILILDEAMSALEPDLEARIRSRIAEVLPGRTLIVVSHRPEELASADTVVRIEAGRVHQGPETPIGSLPAR